MKQRELYVDRKDREAVLCTFELHSTLELIDGVLETLLIQQKLATAESFRCKAISTEDSYLLVVLGFAPLWEVGHRPSESRHTPCKFTHFVLSNSKLDV